MTGYVSDDLLVELNRAAYLVVFPSRYEGFGLPVLEARRCGAPVICGDNSSFREVVPDSAARFDSESTDSIHRLLERGLTDRRFRQRLLDADVPPFTWDEAARLTLSAYDEVLAQRDRSTMVHDHRPSIAYVDAAPTSQERHRRLLVPAPGRAQRIGSGSLLRRSGPEFGRGSGRH